MCLSKQASAQSKRRGLPERVLFAVCECIGLLKGAVLQQAAKWAAPDSYITVRSTPRESTGPANELVELQRRLEQLIRSMEFAIAHHDFPKARFYSDQERATRAHLLKLVNQTPE